MHFLLNKDGSYRKVDKIVSLEGIKYIAVDISTAIKGPVYTMVKASKFKFNRDVVSIDISLEYASQDMPTSEEATINNTINIESVSEYYSIHPLIKQMYDFNDFSAEVGYIENCIIIDKIHYNIEGKDNNIYSDDAYDEVNTHFLSSVFNTQTDEIFDSKVLVLTKDKQWKFCPLDEIPKSLKYVGISIPGISTFYMLTKKQYYKLLYILNLKVIFDDRPFYPKLMEMDTLVGADEYDCESDFCDVSARTLSNILRICLHTPQLLLLQKTVYDKTVALILRVEQYGCDIKLTITDKETFEGICLFKILIKLLGF